MAALKHLVIRNRDLAHPDPSRPWLLPNPKFEGRIGAWNTVMLTACGQLLQPDEPRDVTLRLDMVTCPNCTLWADCNGDKLVDDGHGHRVTA